MRDQEGPRGSPPVPGGPFKFPELPALLFLGLLAGLLCLPHSHSLADLDICWLLRFGQLIWENGRLPERELFSFTQAGKPLTLYQWGFEVYLAGLHRLAGLAGVIWGTALLVALTYSLLLHFLLRLKLPGLLALGLVILAMLAGNHYWYCRPGTVNFLLFLLLLMLLESYRRAPGAQLWALPPLFVLWANLHLGFLVGLTVVGLYGLWALLWPREFRGPGATRDFRLLLLLPLCLAALCLNPYGPRLFFYARSVTSATFLNDRIQELKSPDFHQPVFLFFFAQLALLLWLGGMSLYPGRRLHLALLTLTLGMALYSARHLTFFSLTATLYLALTLAAHQESPAPGPAPGQGWAWAAVGAGLTLLCLAGVNHWRPGAYDFQATRVPRGAAAYLAEQYRGQPFKVFSQDDQWASYLIYRLYPQARVFIDTRYEFFGEEFTRQYLELVDQARHDPAALDPWGVDFLLLNKARLSRRPMSRPGWLLAYEDAQALLYRRLPRDPPTPRLKFSGRGSKN